MKRTAPPKVSIIVPIYNTAKYLDTCLDSIVCQTYQNLEIILVDDGSTDDSNKIAKQYAKKDSRIKLFHQENAGQSSARNTGLGQATGDFVGFIDSDDEIDKNFIQKLLEPYNNPNVSLSVCGLQYNWLKTRTSSKVFINHLRTRRKNESKKAYVLFLLAVDGRMYSSFNKLYKKSFLNGVQFDKNLNFAEDTKFVLDYLKNTPDSSKIVFVLEPLCYYNYGTETSTLRKTACDWENWKISYKNLEHWVGKNPKLSESFWLILIYFRWRISNFRSKRRLKH